MQANLVKMNATKRVLSEMPEICERHVCQIRETLRCDRENPQRVQKPHRLNRHSRSCQKHVYEFYVRFPPRVAEILDSGETRQLRTAQRLSISSLLLLLCLC